MSVIKYFVFSLFSVACICVLCKYQKDDGHKLGSTSPKECTDLDQLACETPHAIAHKQCEWTLSGCREKSEHKIQLSRISAGGGTSCALKADDTVQCWGDDEFKESTVPSSLGKVKAVSAGDIFTCALKPDNSVQCRGDDYFKQNAGAAAIGKVKAMSTGGDHVCVIKTDDTVQCWLALTIPALLRPMLQHNAGETSSIRRRLRRLIIWAR